jgi:hypothetical protein
MLISGVSLALTWTCRLCYSDFSCAWASATCFPLSKHWERWHCTSFLRPACWFTVHVGGGSFPISCAVFLPLPLSQAFMLLVTGRCCCSCQPHVCLQLTWEVGLPLSPVEFSSLCHSHQLSRYWLLGMPRPCYRQRLSGLPACLFTVPGRVPFPQSSALSVPHPLSCMSYLFLLLITQFLFFSPGGGLSVQGAMLLWPRHICGSTAVLQSSPGSRLPKLSGHQWLVAPGPSWCLHLTWSGDSLRQLEVWRGQSYAFSQWLCLQNVSPASLQDFTVGGSLSASSL